MPRLAPHAKVLAELQKDYWDFYKELLVYQKAPTVAEAVGLESKFDKLFASVSGYDALIYERATQLNLGASWEAA